MDWWLFIIGFFGMLIIFMLAGVPLAICFLTVSFIFIGVFIGFEAGGELIITGIFQSLSSFTYLSIPLFILMGEIIYNTGTAKRALDGISLFIGRLPGRLALVTIASGAVFGALSGSGNATFAVLGKSIAPEMRERGYSDRIGLGSLLASGGLSMIIPPSNVALILAVVAEVSAARMLMSGILPGLLMAVMYTIFVVISCWIKPELAPVYEVKGVSFRSKMIIFVKDLLPLGIIIFMILGGIYFGITTVSEAAVIGILGSILFAFFRKALSFEVIKNSLINTIKSGGMLLFIIAGAIGYSQLMAYTGASRDMVHYVLSLVTNQYAILVLMMLILVLLGMFLDAASIIMLTVPLFMPIVNNIGMDPYWFLLLFLINMQVASTSPPIGLGLFVLKGVLPYDVEMKVLYKSALPFLMCDLVSMTLIIIFPAIVSFLPSLH